MVLFYEAAGDDAEAQLAEFSSAAQVRLLRLCGARGRGARALRRSGLTHSGSPVCACVSQELQGDGFEFYSVDVSLGDDAREAVKQGLDSFPAVFVKPHALGIGAAASRTLRVRRAALTHARLPPAPAQSSTRSP